MIDLESFLEVARATPLAGYAGQLAASTRKQLRDHPHGNLDYWSSLIHALPDTIPTSYALDGEVIVVGVAADLDARLAARLDNPARTQLERSLMELKPWRKGPFSLFGCLIDSEWRSDMKWDRLTPYLDSLQDALVLDVGCGNGYHCLRALGAGARMALGVDSNQLNLAQFQCVKRYLPHEPVFLLPLRDHQLPQDMNQFDVVFSMGVLHHSREPEQHLDILLQALAPGGQLVLETLAIDGDSMDALRPRDRYAKMRNVWAIPSPPVLDQWLNAAGFEQIKVVDLNRTTVSEQRATPWMEFESLADFLDANDESLTVEGYPAPLRAITVARKPY